MTDDEQLSLQRMLDRAHAAGVREGLAAATRPEDQKLTEEYEQLKRATREQQDALVIMADTHDVLIDVVEVAPDGTTHTYWSTHCRHGNHDACSAVTLSGGTGHTGIGPATFIPRNPAQCKTCSAPCICPCHKPVPTQEENQTDGHSEAR